MLKFGLVCFLISIASGMYCHLGVPIQTRTKISQDNEVYKIQKRCLCPADYYGSTCKYRKFIYCKLETSQLNVSMINQANFMPEMPVDWSIEMDCYIEYIRRKAKSLRQYYLTNNPSNSFGVYDQFGEDVQIVWSNRTDIFDADGNYIEGYNSTDSEEDRYEFTYNSHFFDFPLSNSVFEYFPSVIMQSRNNFRFGNLSNVEFEGQIIPQNFTTTYNNRNKAQKDARDIFDNARQDNDYDKLSKQLMDLFGQQQEQLNINNQFPKPKIKVPLTLLPLQYTDYETIRIEFYILEHYGVSNQYINRFSMNNAFTRIPVYLDGVGKPKVYDKVWIQHKITYGDFLWPTLLAILMTAIVVLAMKYGQPLLQKLNIGQLTQRCRRRSETKEHIKFMDEDESTQH